MLIKKYGFVAVLALVSSFAAAQVSVDFTNTTLPQATTNELGALTLDFNVDGAGAVTLVSSVWSDPLNSRIR